MEIRHIPGRVNPSDTLTRQLWVDDREQADRVQQLDRSMVEHIRVPSTASDRDIQDRLNQLHSKENEREARRRAQEQMAGIQFCREDNASLCVSVSIVQLDKSFRIFLWQQIRTDETYSDIVQKLEDHTHRKEIEDQRAVFSVKEGKLKIH